MEKYSTCDIHIQSFIHRAIKHVLDLLTPFSTANGGPLTLDHVVYVEGRGNLIIGYTPEGASGTIGFIGSHLDVVPADPETWERDPFKLTIEVSAVCYTYITHSMVRLFWLSCVIHFLCVNVFFL